MEQDEQKSRLIGNRRVALVALVLTGFVGASTFRSLLLHSPVSPYWLPMGTILPRWLSVPFNVAIYTYLLWLCFWFFQAARDKEKFLVAGWCPGLLLGPFKHMVSDSGISAIEFVQAIGITVAFAAALLILIERRSEPSSASSSVTR